MHTYIHIKGVTYLPLLFPPPLRLRQRFSSAMPKKKTHFRLLNIVKLRAHTSIDEMCTDMYIYMYVCVFVCVSGHLVMHIALYTAHIALKIHLVALELLQTERRNIKHALWVSQFQAALVAGSIRYILKNSTDSCC